MAGHAGKAGFGLAVESRSIQYKRSDPHQASVVVTKQVSMIDVVNSVLASSGASSAYAADIVIIMDLYFHVRLSALASIVLLLTTQCIGFGLAGRSYIQVSAHCHLTIPGMLQGLLVNSPAMYWPSTLVTVQLFTTLYSSSSSTLSRAAALATRDRLRVFIFVFLVAFCYHFLPFLVFPTLTSIAVLCLINNQSWWMRALGSGYKGLGMFDFSLDWSSIPSPGPLYTPYWALGNFFAGMILICWVVRTSCSCAFDSAKVS